MEIYKHISIFHKFPLIIESTFAYDDFILVGTKEGYLLLYKVDINSITPTEFELKADLLCSMKQFSRKPILQLHAIPEHLILVSLSDSLVSIHNLEKNSFSLISQLSKTKGASYISLDVDRPQTLTGQIQCTVRLCVVVKYSLLLFYWKNGEFQELRPVIKLSDIARIVVWSANNLFVGFRNQYAQVCIQTGTVKMLFSFTNTPLILPLLAESGLALCRENKTFVLDKDSRPLLDYAITWSDTPMSIAEDILFLFAVESNSVVEVITNAIRDSSKLVFVQKIDLSSLVSKPLRSISKWQNRVSQLVVQADHDVILLKAISPEQQIRLFQEEKHFELALKFVEFHFPQRALENENSGDSEKLKLKIRKLHALHLFCGRQFREALQLFQTLDTDPSYVISLYPDILPENFRAQFLNYPVKPPNLEGAALEQGLLALIDYLLEVRRRIINEVANCRKESDVKKCQDLQSIIDTSLLKCYLHTNDGLVAPLLRIPDNHCHLEETEKALSKRQKYNELVILYKTKGLHRNALDLLQRQAKLKTNEMSRLKLIHYLQELGPEHIDLIFEYSDWLLKQFPQEGLKIFIDDCALEPDLALPRERVLKYLEGIDSQLVLQYLDHCVSQWADTTTKFHDTLIDKYRDRIRSLMREYQLQYCQKEYSLSIEVLDEELFGDYSESIDENIMPKQRKEIFLKPEPAGQEPGELGQLRRKLMELLESSNYYTTETLPLYLQHDGLYEERAIVMGKIGNHWEALRIYVHILHDLKRAEEYCLRQYYKPIVNRRSENNREVFLLLFKHCLRSQPEQLVLDFKPVFNKSQYSPVLASLEPNLQVAMYILGRHSTRINLLRAIELLPPTLPLTALNTILLTSMQHLTSRKNYVQMLRQLLNAQRLRTQQSRIEFEQSVQILLTTHDICHFCAKKIGKSVFVRYNNNHIIHLGCRELYETEFGL